MKLYLAGPLFTTPERDWNVGLAARIRAGGHEVFLPQDNPAAERTGRAIFLKDLQGGKITLDGGVPGRVFFGMLYENVMEGLFSDPVYGGNKDKVG